MTCNLPFVSTVYNKTSHCFGFEKETVSTQGKVSTETTISIQQKSLDLWAMNIGAPIGASVIYALATFCFVFKKLHMDWLVCAAFCVVAGYFLGMLAGLAVRRCCCSE